MWDEVWIHLNAATMAAGADTPYGTIEDAAIGIENGRIAWIGPRAALSGEPGALARRVVAMDGLWATPGLIDCHTHAVFGGERIGEFEARLSGASYESLAKAGGGIRATVTATRAADINELVNSAASRLEALRYSGVTTVEIKSGYGLDLETELTMLDAAGRAAAAAGLRVRRTYLGLHAPPADEQERAAYVARVCSEILPEAHVLGLVDAVDAFCETIGFTPGEVRAVFKAARSLGLPVKLHAEQLSDMNGAALAAGFGALSADHLEFLSEAGAAAMARAGVTAVLLPGAFYTLGETRKPPVAMLRDHGVQMAVATDLNPGSSPLLSATLAANMACTLFGLTPEEALAGLTRCAAGALGLEDECGTLEAGKAADIALWRISRPAEIAYWIGLPGPERLYAAGRPLFEDGWSRSLI